MFFAFISRHDDGAAVRSLDGAAARGSSDMSRDADASTFLTGRERTPTAIRTTRNTSRRRETLAHHHAAHTLPPQVLVMSVMFVGFVVLLHIYGKLTAVPDAPEGMEDPIMPEPSV